MFIDGHKCPDCHREISYEEWADDLDSFLRYFCDICKKEFPDDKLFTITSLSCETDDLFEVCQECCKKPLAELVRFVAENEKADAQGMPVIQPPPPTEVIHIIKLINEAQVFAVLAVNSGHAMMKMDGHLGYKLGTLTEADVEIHSMGSLRREIEEHDASVVKVAEL